MTFKRQLYASTQACGLDGYLRALIVVGIVEAT